MPHKKHLSGSSKSKRVARGRAIGYIMTTAFFERNACETIAMRDKAEVDCYLQVMNLPKASPQVIRGEVLRSQRQGYGSMEN